MLISTQRYTKSTALCCIRSSLMYNGIFFFWTNEVQDFLFNTWIDMFLVDTLALMLLNFIVMHVRCPQWSKWNNKISVVHFTLCRIHHLILPICNADLQCILKKIEFSKRHHHFDITIFKFNKFLRFCYIRYNQNLWILCVCGVHKAMNRIIYMPSPPITYAIYDSDHGIRVKNTKGIRTVV